MRAGVLFHKLLLITMLLAFAARGVAQQCPSPLAVTPAVDYRLSYDPASQRFTAWFVPSASESHRLTTAQFTIIAPNGYTPAQNALGRDANFAITNINGSWTDFVFDNELFATGQFGTIPSVNGLAVHQVGMAPQAVDIYNVNGVPVTAGTPVPLFSFPATGCAGQLRILVNDEPLRNDILRVYGSNVNNSITIQVPIEPFRTSPERYCKNDAQSVINLVLPEAKDLALSQCATGTTFTGNYFTQVLRDWNPASLPTNTLPVSGTATQWNSFTVTGSSSAAVSALSINEQTGAYTLTYPKVGGVTQPGSVTIANAIRDKCNTAQKTARVIINWSESGQISIANNSPVCLVNGSATVNLSVPDGFSAYNWTGPGLSATTGSAVTASLSSPGTYTYTVVGATTGACSATATTQVVVSGGLTPVLVSATNPTSCSGTNGSITLGGLTAGQSFTAILSRSGGTATTQVATASQSGQITLTGLSAGTYSVAVSGASSCAGNPVSATLSEGGACQYPPVISGEPIVTVPNRGVTVCVPITDLNAGDTHTATICGQPSHGSATVSVNNQTHQLCVAYTPNGTFTGQDKFCVIVCDQTGRCDTTSFPIIVGPPSSPTTTVGEPPQVPVKPIVVFPGGTTTSCVPVLDANVGDVHSFTICGQPTSGTATVALNTQTREMCITYTAPQGFMGNAGSVCVRVCDQTGLCTTVTIPVVVVPSPVVPTVNQPPLVAPPTFVTNINTPQTICVPINDPNAGDSHTVTICGQPVSGTLTVGAVDNQNHTVCVTYTPPQGFTGNVSGGCIRVCDQTGACTNVPVGILVLASGSGVNCPVIGSVVPTNPTSCTAQNGSITLTGLTALTSYTVCYAKTGSTQTCQTLQANQNGRIVIPNLGVGQYTAITVAAAGCTSTPVSATLAGGLPAPTDAVCSLTAVCAGQPVVLTSSGTGLQWSGPGLSSTTGNSVTAIPPQAGLITYTVTQSANGCVSPPASVTVVVKSVPTPAVVSTTSPTCGSSDGRIMLGNLTAGQSYTVCYSKNGTAAQCQTLQANGNGQLLITSLGVGTYSLTVMTGGCISQPVSAVLSGTTTPVPTVTASTSPIICLGKTVTLTASGQPGASFTWSGNGLSSTSGTTVTASPTATGTLSYSVTQTVANCTSAAAVISITLNPVPTVASVSKTSPTSCSVANGSLTLNGLTAPGSYTVCYRYGENVSVCLPMTATANGQLQLTNLAAGVYSLTVTGAGGCSSSPISTTLTGPVCPQCTDAPLLAAQPILVCINGTQRICMSILDADTEDTFMASVCGTSANGATATVTVDNQTRQLCLNYQAPTGFQGLDQVCITIRDKCGNTEVSYVPVQVIRCVCPAGEPPIVVPQPILTLVNTPKTLCVPVTDTPSDAHTVTLCGQPQNGTAVVAVNNQTHELCITYTPRQGYVGPDAICIVVCDQSNLCTTVNVPVLVIQQTLPQCPPALSAAPIVTNCSSTTSACMPIVDCNANDTFTVTFVSGPQNGTASASVNNQTNQVCFTYTPRAGFEGQDQLVVRIEDQTGLWTNVTVPLYVNPGTCPNCTTIDFRVLLEGPYDPGTGRMSTTLNQRGLLPGQTPIGQFAVATPPGQPYKTAPWNYTGTESLTTYPTDVVDWVLVSLRTDSLTTASIFRVAGLLHSDGRISFVQPCFQIPNGSYYAVIEHRNHMGVMSPRRIPVVNNRLTFDFTLENAYVITDPPSFGQVQAGSRWLMYAGDGKKDAFTDNFDVNFYDSQLWKTESGIFDQYRSGDFNLDADVNFKDSVLWKQNNGRYSRVPH